MSHMVLTGGQAETALHGQEQMRREPFIGPRKMGVLMFLGSESILFLTMIAQYVHGQAHPNGPTPSQMLNVPVTLGFSVALWLSSLTMQLAPHALQRGSYRLARMWMYATVVLGGIFLFGEVREWLDLASKNVTASRNIWATTYYALTGIHGIHVIVGLAFILGTIGFSYVRRLGHHLDSGLEVLTIYWHFVDGMWVLIFGLVYFWSAFLKG